MCFLLKKTKNQFPAIRFIVDQKYELESEVNELWQSYPGVKSVRIVFKNPEDDRSDCGKHLLLLMLKQASQVDQDLRVVRNVWNSQKIYLKTLEWNLAVRVKMFYIYILQDYDPSGVPISRPYIITSKDVSFFLVIFCAKILLIPTISYPHWDL